MQNDKEEERERIIKMLTDQVSKLEGKISTLIQRISKMEGCCAERHKNSLDAQLQKLQAKETFEEERQKKMQDKIEQMEKRMSAHQLQAQQRFNDILKGMETRCRDVQEVNNQFRTRIKTLEEQRSAREEQRITIKTQVIIGVLVALLTSIVMSAFTYIANFHITYNDGNKNTKTVQTVGVNEQGHNK